MGTVETKLGGSDRAYTRKDIEDGKCRPNGTAWGPGEGKNAKPVVEPQAEAPTVSVPDTAADVPATVGEATSEEKTDGDNPDSEKSPDNPE